MENDKTRRAKRVLSAAAVASLLAIFTLPAFTISTAAMGKIPSPAPGPIVGAGLPILAIGVGYGVYWLVKRRRNGS